MPIKKTPGFTLIELLVVIAIIGVLATLAMVAVSFARERAKVAKAQSEINEIYKAMAAMANDTGEWPGHSPVDATSTYSSANLSSGAVGIVADDVSGTPFNNWAGPYMAKIPTDPWGGQYFFRGDYRVDASNQPGCTSGCTAAAVIGSAGRDLVGSTTDDVIKVIIK